MPSDTEKETTYYPACSCQCGCPPDQPAKAREFHCTVQKEPIRSIKVLDEENQSSRDLYEAVLKTVQHLGISPEIIYLSEPKKTSPYYVDLPAIVVNERVMAQGSCFSTSEIETLLQK